MPFMCGSSHMPRKEEGSAHKRTKPQTPAPRGDTSLADERVKADRETQRRERGQAKQRALQHASTPAKASMRDRGTESELTVVRKRPAQSEDETLSVSESGALPATLAESEMSQSAPTTNPQQAMPAEEPQPSHTDSQQAPSADESQPSQATSQQVGRPVEETTPIQSGESSIQESSVVKKRVTKKGPAAIAEQGAITDLRSHDTSASSAGDPKSAQTPKTQHEPKPASVARPPSSPKAASVPKSVPSPKAISPKAIEPKGTGPAVTPPIAASPKAAAPKTASPKPAVQKKAPLPKTISVPKAQAGRVCCTQIRRVTTQSASRNTKDIWNISRDSLVVGYTHGTEKLEHWDKQKTKVLFLTEGIVMRQVMSHDEHRHPETILPGCKVLMLDEAHSGSTDIELILARILPRISQVKNFRLVLMSATLNIDTFLRRVTDAGVHRSDVGIFHMDERTNPLALYCVPPNLLRERDNMELALRMIIKIHHEYRNGYEGSKGSITGPILVFVPGKAEIRLLTELIKNAIKRGYTSGLYPYGFHADTPDRDRTFLTNGGEDPDPSRYGELQNYNKGRKGDEKHPCNASPAARPENPERLPARRVIISTNAAETAVTFKDCLAVIDTCLVNQMVYDPVAKTQIHATVPCPKTASKQRAGRTGRTIPGINIK